jgi:hypothetical protein
MGTWLSSALEGEGGWRGHQTAADGRGDSVASARSASELDSAALSPLPSRRQQWLASIHLPPQGGKIFLAAMMVSVGLAQAEPEKVGLWVKNTSAVPVSVVVDGVEACKLEAPAYIPCSTKITKLNPAKDKGRKCTSNTLKISCITNVPAAGADVALKRSDGVAYNLRVAKGGALYLCVEPAALTDCFGVKLQ